MPEPKQTQESDRARNENVQGVPVPWQGGKIRFTGCEIGGRIRVRMSERRLLRIEAGGIGSLSDCHAVLDDKQCDVFDLTVVSMN